MINMFLIIAIVLQSLGLLFKVYVIIAPKFKDEQVWQGYCMVTIPFSIIMEVLLIAILCLI